MTDTQMVVFLSKLVMILAVVAMVVAILVGVFAPDLAALAGGLFVVSFLGFFYGWRHYLWPEG